MKKKKDDYIVKAEEKSQDGSKKSKDIKKNSVKGAKICEGKI